MVLAPLSAPPMGWNSWNRLRCGVTEEQVLGMADALVDSGMRDAGYTYVVVDDCWQAPRRGSDGRLQPHPERFPSGMAELGAQLHRRGLKFGLYLAPGRRTCAEIYDRYGERGGLGSFGREALDLETLLDWEIDFLKYDWCRAQTGGTGLDERTAFTRMSQLVAAADREIVLSISDYGRSRPWEWAQGVAHSWRTTQDISPRWARILKLARATQRVAAHSRPWAVNDPDMLEVGNGRLDAEASWSHLAMWAMLGAPLMAGNDLRTMSEATRRTLLDPALLSLAQDRKAGSGAIVARRPGLDVWRRELPTGPVWLLVNSIRLARPVHLERLGVPVDGTATTAAGPGPSRPRMTLPPRGALLVHGVGVES